MLRAKRGSTSVCGRIIQKEDFSTTESMDDLSYYNAAHEEIL
jgi:hypothetical protein